jgi:beta-glucosidase
VPRSPTGGVIRLAGIDEVNNGFVSMDRINDAVRRILTKKSELGLFEHPFTNRQNIDEVGSNTTCSARGPTPASCQ